MCGNIVGARWWCPQRMFPAVRGAYVDRRGAVVHGAWEHASASWLWRQRRESRVFRVAVGVTMLLGLCAIGRVVPPLDLGVAATAVVTVVRGCSSIVVVVAVDGRLAVTGLVLVAIGLTVMLRLLRSLSCEGGMIWCVRSPLRAVSPYILSTYFEGSGCHSHWCICSQNVFFRRAVADTLQG